MADDVDHGAAVAFLRRLLPHQREGVEWMLRREAAGAPLTCGGVLADGVGIGKSHATTGLLVFDALTYRGPSLLVLPSLLVPQWVALLREAGLTP